MNQPNQPSAPAARAAVAPAPPPAAVAVANFVIEASQQPVEQVFFDGVSGFTVGAANCKLDFHQVVGMDQKTKTEKRRIVLTAVLPTAALIELCQNTLASIRANAPLVRNALTEHDRKILGGLVQAPVKDEVDLSK